MPQSAHISLLCILVIALSANLPIPLFPYYTTSYQLSDFDLTLIFSVYGLVIFGMLLIVSDLNDKFGPEWVVDMALIMAIISSFLFAFASANWMILVARCLTGLSVGLFMGAGNALYLKRSTLRHDQSYQLANLATMLGFGLGPIITSLWVYFIPASSGQTPYLIYCGILIITYTLNSDWLKGQGFQFSTAPLKIRPNISLPKAHQRSFILFVCPIIFVMFSLNGALIALLPSFLLKVIQSSNPLWSGMLIFLLMVGGALAQQLPWLKQSKDRAFYGIIALALGAGVFLLSGWLQSISVAVVSVLILAIVVAGHSRAVLYWLTNLLAMATVWGCYRRFT